MARAAPPLTRPLPPPAALPAAAVDPFVVRYLEYARVEKRLAARTLVLYALDLEKLAQLAAQVGVPLLELQTAQVRRFVA